MWYLDVAQLNKVLIRPIHMGLTLNDILPKLTGVKYLMWIDASPGYHKLKLGEKSYLLTFSCPFGRYHYARLPFGATVAGVMFQKR